MTQLRLNLETNLHEKITYQDHIMPLSICVDHFDRYYHREWPSHWHEEIEMSVLKKGELAYKIFDSRMISQTVTLTPGDGIFINSSALHSAHALKPDTVLKTIIVPLPLFNLAPFNTIQKKYIVPIIHSQLTELPLNSGNPTDRVILQAVAEICDLTEEADDYELHSFELVCRIWRNLLKQFKQAKDQLSEEDNNVRYERVKRMIQFIHENYARSIAVADVADAVGISRAECFRSFKEAFNDTPANYLNDYRLSMAAILLADNSLSITAISTDCGFRSASYFGKKFREHFESTPKDYRRKLTEGP